MLELFIPSISKSTTLSPYSAKNHSIGLANLIVLSDHLIDFGNVSSKTRAFKISGSIVSVGFPFENLLNAIYSPLSFLIISICSSSILCAFKKPSPAFVKAPSL